MIGLFKYEASEHARQLDANVTLRWIHNLFCSKRSSIFLGGASGKLSRLIVPCVPTNAQVISMAEIVRVR